MAEGTTCTLNETLERMQSALRRVEDKLDYTHRLLGHRPDELWPLYRVLAPRALDALRGTGVDSIRALRHLTDTQLLALPQFGKKALEQTHTFLAEHEAVTA